MDINVKLNFLATFAGVILSFSLWFLGEHIIKWCAQRKEREAMNREIIEEAKFNILVLSGNVDFAKKSLGGGDVPLFIPRLRTSASSYAISSGNIRLLKSRRKQLLVRYMNVIYDEENRFAQNTELLLAVLLLRSDGRTWVDYRLTCYVQGTPKTIETLQDFLNKFQQKDLPEDKWLDDWTQASKSGRLTHCDST